MCVCCKEFIMCFARLSFVCLRTKLLFTVGAVSDRRRSYVYTAHEHAGSTGVPKLHPGLV